MEEVEGVVLGVEVMKVVKMRRVVVVVMMEVVGMVGTVMVVVEGC